MWRPSKGLRGALLHLSPGDPEPGQALHRAARDPQAARHLHSEFTLMPPWLLPNGNLGVTSPTPKGIQLLNGAGAQVGSGG